MFHGVILFLNDVKVGVFFYICVEKRLLYERKSPGEIEDIGRVSQI